MGYLSILAKLADALKWAFSHPRLALELALVAGLLFIGWRYNRKTDELAAVNAQHGTLEAGLQQQITIANGQIEILKKEKGKTTYIKVFVPPEGSIIVKQADWDTLNQEYQSLVAQLANTSGMSKEEIAALQKRMAELLAKLASLSQGGQPGTTIIIKDKGFTFKPGFGVEWAGCGLSPRLDIKWVYFKRYSSMVGGSRDGIDISASRHLDDLLWGRPNNIELFGGYKVFRMRGASQFVVGLRSNF